MVWHRLLSGLYITHCVFLVSLSKFSWRWMHGFLSGLSALYDWSVRVVMLVSRCLEYYSSVVYFEDSTMSPVGSFRSRWLFFLWFCLNTGSFLPIQWKNCSFYRNWLNHLQCFRQYEHWNNVIFPIHDYRLSFNLLTSSSIFLLKLSSLEHPKYFMIREHIFIENDFPH